MDAMTRAMLNDAGFQSGSVGELLGLDEVQEAIVETKVRLTALLREERKARNWSQAKLAKAIGSRQQVVARAEMAHKSVTTDLLMRCLLTLGVSLGRIASELEAGEAFLASRKSAGQVELVEIAPIRGLVRPERVVGNATISDVRPLLRMVKSDKAMHAVDLDTKSEGMPSTKERPRKNVLAA